MSCETWSELASQGEKLLREGSLERTRAERHFARCPSCAERAFLLDPSWALSRSREEAFEDTEIKKLKRDVLVAARIRDVEGSLRSHRRGLQAAAVLLVTVVGGGVLLRGVGSPDIPALSPVEDTVVETVVPSRAAEALPASEARVEKSLPTVGSLAPAAARIYDFGQQDFALVMVVHETLDL